MESVLDRKCPTFCPKSDFGFLGKVLMKNRPKSLNNAVKNIY